MFAKTEFRATPQRLQFAEEELKTLAYWGEIGAFKQQVQKTKDLPKFSFYDGPPFATGTPHYGHITAGTIKDVVCRYAVQTGHSVERRFGWDCHGLPVQYEINKQLNIKGKQDVLDMGIAQYNQACRAIVMKYSREWEYVVGRYGRWIDFQNDYKTMDLAFMESVWHVFKSIFDKGLVYRSRKIMPYSNACNTVLSNFEVQLNYKDVHDPSAYVSFPLVSDPTVKFVAWTTTPWTLPSNLALAVNPNFIYSKVRDVKRNEVFIIAECRLKEFFGKEAFEVLEQMKGIQLQGCEYVPLFDYFKSRQKDGCFRVLAGDFVTAEVGTGVVHCAPGFGEEDYKLCVEKKVIGVDNPVVPLDDDGRFTSEVRDFVGVYVKDADKKILERLKTEGRVVSSSTILHSYPMCWRSDTPLIYKAVATWFIRVTAFRDELIANNHKAEWVPKNIQLKKFDNWLKDAKDWCFSRSRFWGNPIPLWVSDDGEEVVCVGSVAELQALTGAKVTDLHRHHIDHLTIESKRGKGKLRRIEEVFDCWFESGSMPFAQVHYPFSMKEEQFVKIFPANFIAEGIDQTRGWFYTLNVIATAMRGENPYRNLIVNGLVLDEFGRKMSKKEKNYPDPVLLADEYGADAVRFYLMNSPVVRAQNLNFSKKGVHGVVRDVLLPWYNAYRFLIQNISKWEGKVGRNFQFGPHVPRPPYNVLDCWIQSALQLLINKVRKEMDEYKLYNVAAQLAYFLDQLTNWYVRLSRLRLKGEGDDQDTHTSLIVLFDVLLNMNILMSPQVPFLTEHMYQNMRMCLVPGTALHQPSIHHLFIAAPNFALVDEALVDQMQAFQSIVETARKLREQRDISLKQPLLRLTIISKDAHLFPRLTPFLQYLREECNVEEIDVNHNVEQYIKAEAQPNLPVLGPRFKGTKFLNAVKEAVAKLTTQQIDGIRVAGKITLAEQQIALEDLIIKEKVILENIQPYQAIGGTSVIVLLDTRQNQALKLKGFAREIINRIQKLKKKAHITAEDQVLIFYSFPHKSHNLHQAFATQRRVIEGAVKKPIFEMEHFCGHNILAQENGDIDSEEYSLKVTKAGPVFNLQQMKEQFGVGSDRVLMTCVMEMPSANIKNQVKIRLDGKDCLLLQGKHYTYYG